MKITVNKRLANGASLSSITSDNIVNWSSLNLNIISIHRSSP